MKKILIATKNKDKFEIVTRILNKINNASYEYYSLYDIKNIEKSDKEEGNIEERAYNKANQIYSNIKENDFEYIIGIDDGIKMKGILRENVKDYIEDIINDQYLSEGEQIEIVRAYCFMNKKGEYKTVTTEIPFKYQRYNGSLKIEKNCYPLSNVLRTLTSDRTVAQMDKDENNKYYLHYSEKKIKEVLQMEPLF